MSRIASLLLFCVWVLIALIGCASPTDRGPEPARELGGSEQPLAEQEPAEPEVRPATTGELSESVDAAEPAAAPETAIPESESVVKEAGAPSETVAIASEPAPPPPARFALTIRTKPPSARIRVMNIAAKYDVGMRLPPGTYDIFVEQAGYHGLRRDIEIKDGDVDVLIILVAR